VTRQPVSRRPIPDELVQGSRSLTYAQLLAGSDDTRLFQDPSWHRIFPIARGEEPTFSDGHEGVSVEEEVCKDGLLGYLERLLLQGSKGVQRVILTGRSDIGKTTIAYALLDRISRGPSKDAGPPPVIIPLRLHSSEYATRPAYFGTRLWMRSGNLFAFPRNRHSGRQRRLFILDDVEELFAQVGKQEVASLLQRPLLQDAGLVLCSEELYARLAATDYMRTSLILQLDGLHYQARIRFAERYLAYLWRDQRAPHQIRGQSAAHDLPSMQEEARLAVWRDELAGATFREPLYLLIATEGVARIGTFRTHLEFYIRSRLEQEVLSGARMLPPEQMLECLGELAVNLATYQGSGDSDDLALGTPTQLSLSSFAIFLRESSAKINLPTHILRKELLHTRFVQWSPNGVSLTSRQLQDYFLAQAIMYELLSRVASLEQIVERFLALLPGGVVEHMDAELRRLQLVEELHWRVIRNLAGALVKVSSDHSAISGRPDSLASLSSGRRRVACEQLSYYLGVAIGGGPEGDWLLRFLEGPSFTADDAWIKRGILVGLGQGGRAGAVETYLGWLREEKCRHDSACSKEGVCDPGENRRVNVEFNIVLFGDERARDGQPDRCLYPRTCERTLAGMIGLLEDEGASELARLVLFIIADLCDYHWDKDPTKNLATMWEHLLSPDPEGRTPQTDVGPDVASGPTLRRRLDRILQDLSKTGWPEVREAQVRLEMIYAATEKHTPTKP
jgi:hypothetical protein